ncbi:MAG: ABC transporter permease [Anaerolineae bacterium]|jgi:ABC-type dipeptide/oligopeptide/nickel transport system permease component|nr:ABC transporter permease [Anaerolineae bacterium]
MARYLLSRILSLFFVLFAVSVITFTLMHSVPGGPFDEGKQRLPEAAKANILRKYGLDQPIYIQYAKYMWNALHLDFGIPYQVPTETVMSLIRKTWFITFQVGIMTVMLAFGVGIVVGTVAAYRRGSWIDTGVTFFAMLGTTLPNFVVALWLILVFAYGLKLLPSGGWNEPNDWLIQGVFSKDWILPVLAYALLPMAIVARYTRASMVDALQSDYVRTARAKGLRDRNILSRHVLKNAAIPMVTALGPIVPDLITGSIFIEAVFRIPGLGKYFVTSTFNRDYPMIMALMLLIALIWGITYIVTDVLYAVLDPRVRLGGTMQ